jgi:radical SAM protein with 4Fe4S-binding SPASM domain
MIKRRKYRVQEPPFSVTFELTEGCNLSCPMCAVQAIQEKQGKGMKYMAMETIENAMQQIRDLKWNCRIGFAMRGEPSLHPRCAEMIAIVRMHRPRCHITMLTNGGGLVRKPGPVENVRRLFDAGVNVLGLDDYENVNLVSKIIESIELEHGKLESGKYSEAGFNFFRYPEDLRGNPHQRRPRGTRMLVQIRDIMAQAADKKIGTHGKVFNYAGLAFPPNETMAGKRCHQPFRQLAIRYDGSVAVCCNDWLGEYKCGNVLTDGVAGVWQGAAMGAAREMLIRGKREMRPCKGCDHRSYRVGLLPDLLGKGKLHRPDAQTAADVAQALEGGTYTPQVRTPWHDRVKS